MLPSTRTVTPLDVGLLHNVQALVGVGSGGAGVVDRAHPGHGGAALGIDVDGNDQPGSQAAWPAPSRMETTRVIQMCTGSWARRRSAPVREGYSALAWGAVRLLFAAVFSAARYRCLPRSPQAGTTSSCREVEEVLAVQAADQHTVFCQRDDAGLLGLTTTTMASEFSLMPRPARWRVPMSLPISRLLDKGQHAARRHNDAVPDDNCAVVQGCALVKDGAQHFGDDVGMHRRAGADDLVQVIAALQHHQGTGAGVGKLFSRVADGNNGALPRAAQRRVTAAVAEQTVRPTWWTGPCAPACGAAPAGR